MIIYLIRHSITNLNSASAGYPIMCGSTQAHITEEGIELARKVGREYDFAGNLEKVKEIYCSTLDRTLETAKEMFPQLIDRVNVHRCPAFDEIDFGDYETVPKYDLPEEMLSLWDDKPEELIFPGGDSMKDRAIAGVEELVKLAEQAENPFIVVSSSTVLRLMLTVIMEIPFNRFHGIQMDNCNVVELEYDRQNQSLRVKNV